eukprot:469542_1
MKERAFIASIYVLLKCAKHHNKVHEYLGKTDYNLSVIPEDSNLMTNYDGYQIIHYLIKENDLELFSLFLKHNEHPIDLKHTSIPLISELHVQNKDAFLNVLLSHPKITNVKEAFHHFYQQKNRSVLQFFVYDVVHSVLSNGLAMNIIKHEPDIKIDMDLHQRIFQNDNKLKLEEEYQRASEYYEEEFQRVNEYYNKYYKTERKTEPYTFNMTWNDFCKHRNKINYNVQMHSREKSEFSELEQLMNPQILFKYFIETKNFECIEHILHFFLKTNPLTIIYNKTALNWALIYKHKFSWNLKSIQYKTALDLNVQYKHQCKHDDAGDGKYDDAGDGKYDK